MSNDPTPATAFIAGLALGLVIGLVMLCMMQGSWERSAVKKGKAEWVTNASGRPEWRWKGE